MDEMGQEEPTTERIKSFRAMMSVQRWQREVSKAQEKARIMEEVCQKHAGGLSWHRSLKEVAQEVKWSTFVHWQRKRKRYSGPLWERLVDTRIPPPGARIDESIRKAACLIRRMDRSVNTARAREQLVAEYNAAGHLSDTSLRRIWSSAGLTYIEGESRGRSSEEVVQHSGGGGLALLLAADVETGSSTSLAREVLAGGRLSAQQQGAVEEYEEGPEERNANGQFMAPYNRSWREVVEPGEADGRWASDEAKRGQRVLKDVSLLGQSEWTLSRKLLSMGVVPLLTERRGFTGLEGPAGAWLGVLGGVAYMPATLSKALSELALLNIAEVFWSSHAQRWYGLSQRWSGGEEPWLQYAVYIDATQDPYWTHRFALSGKVSRVGRVMPCLSKVAVMAGGGVPILAETVAGTVSLQSRLLPLLERLDEVVGEGEVGRLTIIDAEMSTARLLTMLMQETSHVFISVLKSHALKSATVEAIGSWESFRERDEVRELEVVLHGRSAPPGGLNLRGVEMRRVGSRNPTPTIFGTNADPEWLSTADVAKAYLSRWPHQEQLFRDARNGGGAERSHGYGGEFIANVALQTKLERARSRVVAAERKIAATENAREVLEASRNELPVALRKSHDKAIAIARTGARQAKQALQKTRSERDRLETMPRLIYARDPNRDSMMTCCKLTVLMLVEFALKEYFDGARMELRTFIEQFVMLPVTVRTSASRILYQIHANPRNHAHMEMLRVACAVINVRKLRLGKRRLEYELVDLESRGP